MSLARPLAAAGLIGLAAAWSLASAQPVFRIVGPDGRVTFGPYTLNPQLWGNDTTALERLGLAAG